MSARDDRAALWAAAGRLSAELARGAKACSPRFATLATPPAARRIRLGEIAMTPAWFGEPGPARAARLALAGAAAMAPVWRGAIDGALLRRVAEIIGSQRLQTLLSQAADDPLVRWPPAERGEPLALAQLGARVFAATLTPALAALVARLGAAPPVTAGAAGAALSLLTTLQEAAP